MAWNLNAATPIYQQLVDRIKNDIISGKYEPGQKIPGVRDMAMEASVNPNTMQRALSELEKENLIITLGTTGRIVTSDTKRIELERENILCDITKAYVAKIISLGYDKKKAAEFIMKIEEENS